MDWETGLNFPIPSPLGSQEGSGLAWLVWGFLGGWQGKKGAGEAL